MSDPAPEPRWSRLAWITFVCGLVPTVAGQLLAPLLGIATWLEIRAARGRQRGLPLAVAGVCVAAGWIVLAVTVVQHEYRSYVQTQETSAAADGPCRERMLEVAEAWAQANLMDPAVADLHPGEVLPWLVAQGYCEARSLQCPLETQPRPGGSFRFIAPLPARVIPPERCVVLFESRARHRRNGKRGHNVVFNDGHAEFLPHDVFQQVMQRQEAARVAAKNQ